MARKRINKSAAQRVTQSSSLETEPNRSTPKQTRPPRDFRPRLTRVTVAAGLCVLALLAWSNSFGTGFAFDNRGLILNDPRIQQATSTNFEAASYARMLAPQYTDAYQVMGEALLLANRDEEAAISLIEGLLITADPKLFPLVQKAYGGGLDSKDCAFIQTPGGPSFNFSCEIVHNDLCKASDELIKTLVRAQQPVLAGEVKNRAQQSDLRCSAIQIH
jgi:hypothetical protein